MPAYYHYFVEGNTEKRMVEILKTELQCIVPGRVQVFNVIQNELNGSYLMPLRNRTNIVLIFDTDKRDCGILRKNLDFLKSQSRVGSVICIPQFHTLEEELLRGCDIKNICELTGSKSRKDFKSDMLRCSNFDKLLKKKNFDFNKFWALDPESPYEFCKNESKKIRKG